MTCAAVAPAMIGLCRQYIDDHLTESFGLRALSDSAFSPGAQLQEIGRADSPGVPQPAAFAILYAWLMERAKGVAAPMLSHGLSDAAETAARALITWRR